MFDLGMSELLIIGIVALIIVGPKDLPVMFRTLGRFTAKARGMAREFSRAMESAADEAGVKDVAKDLRKMTDPKSMGMDALKDAASKFESWDPSRNSTRPAPAAAADSAPAPATPAAADTAPAAPVHGPATQALASARAAEAGARAETAAALRAARPGDPRDSEPGAGA